ncbi:MAG: Gfo/Idh/MocA family oxidoreductase [Gemmatimonadales bacterium]
MKKVNLCFLGCGSITRVHSNFARTTRSRVKLLYASRSLERARAYCKKYRGIGAFGSYREACESPQVDAVFICTPHAYHLEQALMAAENGKAMLIEKPITRNLDELAQIEVAVAQSGVTAMLAENYYFKPLVSTLRFHLDRGDIGKPLFVELNHTTRSKVEGWRADAEMMGGGALLEGGVHWINLLCSIGGDITQILAAEPNIPYPKITPVEDSLELLVKFQNGSVGKMIHSWNIASHTGPFQLSKIYGTEGNIVFESNGFFAFVLGIRKRFRIPGLLDIMGYRAMLIHFLDCVTEGRSPAMSLLLARRDMELVDAAYRSLQTNQFERPASAAKAP